MHPSYRVKWGLISMKISRTQLTWAASSREPDKEDAGDIDAWFSPRIKPLFTNY